MGKIDFAISNGRIDALNQVIISMAVESWRFGKVFEKMLMKLDAGGKKRYQSQFHWFIKKVEESLAEAGLLIVNVEGHPFDPGVAATPLNIVEFEAGDSLLVDQMIEPIIMSKEGLVRAGTVTLIKAVK